MKAHKIALVVIALFISFSTNLTGQCDDPVTSHIVTDSTIQLTWNAVPSADKYQVRYRPYGGSGWITSDHLFTTTYTLSELNPCKVYRFQVIAYCTNGSNSGWTNTNPVYTATGGCPSTYAPPQSIEVRYATASSLKLSWKRPVGACRFHTWLRKKGTNNNWTKKWSYVSAIEFTGLDACSEYEFKVKARYPDPTNNNCTKNSSFSTLAFALTSDCLPVPDKLAVKIEAASEGNKVKIRWIPTDYKSMKWGTAYGYTLTRSTLSSGGTPLDLIETFDSKVILDSYTRPLEDSVHWNGLSYGMADVAAGALFGEEMVATSVQNIELMDVVSMNKAEETSFSFGLFAADSDFGLAVEMGLAFEDNSIIAGEKYLYTVKFNNIDSTTKASSASKIIATSDILTLPQLTELSGRGGDSTAFLSWDISQSEELFTSFIVERSDNNGATFQAVNDKPIIYTSNADEIPGQINFTDGLPNNTTTYVFRVKGKSPFGSTSPPSDTIHVKGRPDPIEIAPGLTDVEEVNVGTMKIDWEFDVSFNSEIQGFHVLRAPSRDSVFNPITTSLLSPTVRTFTDNNPEPLNYYRVVAIDNNNYEISSLTVIGQIEDNTPPSAPTNLAATIDDDGILKLTWTESTSDDAIGYRVYTSNQQNGDLAQITQTYIDDTVFYFQINVNALNKHIYYGVKAVDRHENYSDMSAVVQADRPDKIPPAPPRITNVTADYASIFLEWELSTSDDVSKHVLERKVHDIPGWTQIIELDRNQQFYSLQDTSAKVGFWYEYRLLAHDASNNFSSSEIVRARAIDSGVRPPIQNFTGQFFPNDPPSVNLNWNYPEMRPDLVGFTIFRSTDSTNMRTYKSITVEEAEDMATAFGGGGSRSLDLGFIDFDMNFQIPVRASYVIPSTYNPSAPGTIPPRTGGPVFVPTPRTNPSIPGSVTPVGSGSNFELFYQVIAVFKDGSISPLSSFVIIPM